MKMLYILRIGSASLAKLQSISLIRSVSGMGLAEAKCLADEGDVEIGPALHRSGGEAMGIDEWHSLAEIIRVQVQQLEACGCDVGLLMTFTVRHGSLLAADPADGGERR